MTLEKQAGDLLLAQGLTLATAESCTGGLVAHRITNVSGSSAYFLGGIVAYANEAKEALLGVRHETLLAHGAVSEEAAREMARGARQRLGADVGVSVTGIAGPTGGTPAKPVGLVYIALSAADAELCGQHLWEGDRLRNKEQSAQAALRLLLDYLQGHSAARPARSGGARTQKGKGMVEFINESVGVEMRLRPDETALPLAFVWRKRRFQIESWGRESTHPRGGQTVHCYLVQTAGLDTWELCQENETAQWTLVRHWARKDQIA